MVSILYNFLYVFRALSKINVNDIIIYTPDPSTMINEQMAL